jgi:hypothetical protein
VASNLPISIKAKRLLFAPEPAFVGRVAMIPVLGPNGIETRAEPPRWSPAYKDWGFDAIYPATPDPFDQVRAWDREHRGRWIESRASELAGLSNIMKNAYLPMLRAQMDAKYSPFWTVTTRDMSAEAQMHRFAEELSLTRRVKKTYKRWRRRPWRRDLAMKIYPQLQEDY